MPYNPRQVTLTANNLSTINVMNTIRANAGYEYQAQIPEVTALKDVAHVGESIIGNPTMANQYVNALVNRVALVVAKAMLFYNPYKRVKKGFLYQGESVEEVFVDIAKVLEYNPEKGEEREHKRFLPDVRSAFHVVNWRAMYPVTVQENDLRMAFLSEDGMRDFISNIINSVYRAYEYDEFLLIKYLIIKSISHGKTAMTGITGTAFDTDAGTYRGVSNKLLFPSRVYNEAGVLTSTPRDKQLIFMDAIYNGQFDSKALASAFNMDERTYFGSLMLIDDFTTFDNARFNVIRENSDMIEEVTSDELELLSVVKAFICDEDFFQIYDQTMIFKERETASALYWNYFLHSWKVVSTSPFANANAFVTADAVTTDYTTITAEITSKTVNELGTSFVITPQFESPSLQNSNWKFVETETMVTNGIAITPDGNLMIPESASDVEITLELVNSASGKTLTATTSVTSANSVGATVTLG